MPKIHMLGIAYERPVAETEANILGAKIAEAWQVFRTTVSAIPGMVEVTVTDKVVRPTGPKPAKRRAPLPDIEVAPGAEVRAPQFGGTDEPLVTLGVAPDGTIRRGHKPHAKETAA
jgi:hypothetical protein